MPERNLECVCSTPCDPEKRPTGYHCLGQYLREQDRKAKRSTIRILGKEFSVIDTPPSPLSNMHWGHCDSARGEIRVQEDLCPDQRRDTILHECLHAIDYAVSLDISERQVHAMAAGVLALVRDNPDYFRKLFDL